MSLGLPRLESLNFLHFYERRFNEASILEEEVDHNNPVMISQANASPTKTISDAYSVFYFFS